jgi:hypothetical protein
MTTRDQYMAVARDLANYMNAWGLAFKTYAISELDAMMKVAAGEGARVSTKAVAEAFETCLQERGFVVYPSIKDNQEGYVRIYRASSKIGNLLSAFRYPGPNGDNELSKLLSSLSRARRPDVAVNDESDVG